MRTRIKTKNQNLTNQPKPFIDHLLELRQRLLWCLLFFLLASAAAYFIQQSLITWLLYPLRQTVYYTSPVGGFNLILQVCLLFGFFLSLPIFIYQTYRFIQPVFSHHTKNILLILLGSSIFLTLFGIAFAYFISLPAALHFLNSFSTEKVKSLITTNEYFSFASYYLLSFVILFHLPLILLFINYVSPLKIKTLFDKSRYVIVGCFILAAILTPTPDPFNQAMLAVPIIVLYYLSIGLIWFMKRFNN